MPANSDDSDEVAELEKAFNNATNRNHWKKDYLWKGLAVRCQLQDHERQHTAHLSRYRDDSGDDVDMSRVKLKQNRNLILSTDRAIKQDYR